MHLLSRHPMDHPRLTGYPHQYSSHCRYFASLTTHAEAPVYILVKIVISARFSATQPIAMDFVGPFPEYMGYDYLLVVICRFTSLVHLIPTTTSAKAMEIAWLFLKDIVRLHGLPETIVSDRNPKFVSKFWRELHRLMGVKLLMSTAYHPQTDAMGERSIKGVTQVLRGVVKHDQTDWVDRPPMAEFAINSSANESTGFAPFELTYGAMPRIFHKTGLPRSLG